MSRYIFSAGIHRAAVALALIMLSGSPSGAKDVVTFDHPPTDKELESILIKPKTRSIVLPAPPAGTATPATPTAQVSSDTPTAPAVVAAAQGGDAVSLPIQFGRNSAEIQPQAQAYLQGIGTLLARRPSLNLVIEGHTDISGGYDRNMTLSRARAEAVKAHLVTHYGIAASRLSSFGLGPTSPLPGYAASDPRNRRVQFKVQG